MENILDSHAKAYEGQVIYDFDNTIQLNWYPKRILELIENKSSLLELGLGHGITTKFFSDYFDRHIVLEASQTVISGFKKKNPDCNIEIIETYFEEFDTTERFDVIVLGFVLEHVDNPIQIMSLIKKFLNPDGKIFLAVPNAEVLNRRLGNIAGMLPDIQMLSEHDLLCGHKRYYTKDTLKQDIESAGFLIERIEGIYLKPLTTNQMISLNLDANLIEALCIVGIEYPELCCGMLAQIRIPD